MLLLQFRRLVRAAALGVVAGVVLVWSSQVSAGTIELIHGGDGGMRIFFDVAAPDSSPFQGGNYDIGEPAGWEGIGVGSASDQSFPVGGASTVTFQRTTILSAGSSTSSIPRIEIYFQDASQWSSTWNALQGTTLTLDVKVINPGFVTILDTHFSGETHWAYPVPEPSTGLLLATGLLGLVMRRRQRRKF